MSIVQKVVQIDQLKMNSEQNIKNKIGTDPGFRVPDGYFDNVFKQISANLPERETPKVQPVTRWQLIRPYLYMAAMFAGIWLMMKMFHNIAYDQTLSLDNPPENIVLAMQTTESDPIYESSISDFELEDELVDDFESVEDIQESFDYELKPEYANIVIEQK
jgi:hypothetical protein